MGKIVHSQARCKWRISCATQQIGEQHKSANPILNRMRPLAHNSQHSTPKWALVSGCRCCKLAHTLTCTLWPVACQGAMAHGRTWGSQRCRNNLKFRNTKHSAKYIEENVVPWMQQTQLHSQARCKWRISCATQQIGEQHKSANPILNRMPPLAHSSQHSTPKWALVSGCRCCKLTHTLTCTVWPVACQGAMAVHAGQSGAGTT